MIGGVLVLLRHEPPRLLESEDDRRVDAGRLHVLDQHVFQVFGVGHVVSSGDEVAHFGGQK